MRLLQSPWRLTFEARHLEGRRYSRRGTFSEGVSYRFPGKKVFFSTCSGRVGPRSGSPLLQAKRFGPFEPRKYRQLQGHASVLHRQIGKALPYTAGAVPVEVHLWSGHSPLGPFPVLRAASFQLQARQREWQRRR